MLRKSLKVPDQTIGVISIHKILSHLRYTAKTGLWQIFQLSIFSFSAKKNAITKATEQATIDFSFRILVFFPFWEVLNVTVCKPLEFFSVLAAIIRQPHFYSKTVSTQGLWSTHVTLFVFQSCGIVWVNSAWYVYHWPWDKRFARQSMLLLVLND